MNTKRKLIECVPNFSEGKDPAKIKQITDAISSVQGIELLNVDSGADTHRSVVTFVGPPEVIVEAAFRGIQKASELIDMNQHKGAHPRMGATDVCPFIPVEGITMEECVQLAKELAFRVGNELKIPVYLYEEASSNSQRKNLADIRKGEYEALSRKMQDSFWKPDYGPTAFNADIAKTGATVIGAREFLIAFNININSLDKQHANDIAYELRERGRVARKGNLKPFYYRGKKQCYTENNFPCGQCEYAGSSFQEIQTHCEEVHHYDLRKLLILNDIAPQDIPSQLIGKNVYRPGLFKECKAIGWYVKDYQRAQISINLTNYSQTPPHLVYEEAARLAEEKGLKVTGSEIVGLIPYQALLQTGHFYLKKQGKPIGVPTLDVLRTAVMSLGLNDVAPFDISEKVLGLPKSVLDSLSLSEKSSSTSSLTSLVSMSVSDFSDEVSRDTPAPGGGSIAALSGALGAALASMVANLSHGKEGSESQDEILETIAAEAQSLKEALLLAVDEDTQAFNSYMEARRLPQLTSEEKSYRAQQMEEGLKVAATVPLQTARLSLKSMHICKKVAECGNPNSLTDAAVGMQMAYAGVRGGVWNVLINLKNVLDKDFVNRMRQECEQLIQSAQLLQNETVTYVETHL